MKTQTFRFLLLSRSRWLAWLLVMPTLMGVGCNGSCSAHTSVTLLYCSLAVDTLTDWPGGRRAPPTPTPPHIKMAQHRCRAKPRRDIGQCNAIACKPHSYRRCSRLSLLKLIPSKSTLLHYSTVTAFFNAISTVWFIFLLSDKRNQIASFILLDKSSAVGVFLDRRGKVLSGTWGRLGIHFRLCHSSLSWNRISKSINILHLLVSQTGLYMYTKGTFISCHTTWIDCR